MIAMPQNLGLYQESSEQSIMQDFVEKHFNLVKSIALYIKKKLPSHIELNDLLQAGIMGLIEAKQNYRMDMETVFENYARIRIKGSIIDSLRKNSWTTRETSKNLRKISNAIHVIEQRNLRKPTAEEIATELGVSLDKHFEILQEINFSSVLSFEEVDSQEKFLDEALDDPQTQVVKEKLRLKIKNLLKKLPEREYMILSLYYVDEFTFKEIGEMLDLTEARICQLHVQAITRVRASLMHWFS